MIKKVLSIFLFTGYLYASLINGIALTVNDSAITLYDIDEVMQKKGLSHNQAVGFLIDELLYAEEIKKFNLTIHDNELNDYLDKLAAANNMSIEKFELVIKQRQSYNQFLNNTRKRLLNQKLLSKIASGKLKMANDDDIKRYYDNNIDQFRVDKKSIQVMPFEQVKSKIFNIIMTQREQKYLKEYFETLKITADIRIIR